MNPNLDHILSRLEKVRGRQGSYVACCPAHKDRSPSMTVRETPEGKILMHCFAGCSISEIAGAIGVDLSDLFPPEAHDPVRDYSPQKRVRQRFLASELLQAVSLEATIVAVCAHDMAQGKTIPPHDLERLKLASERINEALELSK